MSPLLPPRAAPSQAASRLYLVKTLGTPVVVAAANGAQAICKVMQNRPYELHLASAQPLYTRGQLLQRG